MGCFKIDRRGAVVIKGRFPTRDADAPFIARFESGKSPFRHRRDQIITIEHREIQKVAGYLHANGVETDVFRTGAAEPVAVKSGHRIATTTFQLRPKNVGRHSL